MGNIGRNIYEMSHLINILLLDVGVLQNLLDRLHSLAEKIHIELLKLGTGKSFREIVAVLEGFNLNASGLLAGECSLGLLDFTLQFTESAKVLAYVGASLFLVALDEVIDDTVIEIFTTEMSVTSSSQNLKDTIVNGKEGDIESSTTKIIDDDLRFTTFLVKAIGDGSSGRFVYDAENSKTGDSSSVFSRLTLSIVEVCTLPKQMETILLIDTYRQER